MAIGRPMPPKPGVEVKPWKGFPENGASFGLRARGKAAAISPTWECPMRRWGNGVPDSWNGGWTDCRTNRAGRPRAVTDDDVERVITLTLETAPRDANWSTRSRPSAAG